MIQSEMIQTLDFFQIKKIGNWHYATDTSTAIIEAQRQIFDGG